MHPYVRTALSAASAREVEAGRLAKVRAESALPGLRVLADRLRSECGASKVWLFGSLAEGGAHSRSDADVAAEGLTPEAYTRALGIAAEVVPLPCDVVRMESAPDSLRAWVVETGVRL